MRWAVVVDGVAVNVVEWDGVTPWNPEGDPDLVDVTELPVSIGWTLVDGEWVAPAESVGEGDS